MSIKKKLAEKLKDIIITPADALGLNKDEPKKDFGIMSAKKTDTKANTFKVPESRKTSATKKKIGNTTLTGRDLLGLNTKKDFGIMAKPDYTPLNSRQTVYDKYKKDRYGKGNIDLTARPIYINRDRSISTVSSMSFEEDGVEILVPTIIYDKNGNPKRLTEDEAIKHYHNTGEYLGKFRNRNEATEYAKMLSKEQGHYYNPAEPLKDKDDPLAVAELKLRNRGRDVWMFDTQKDYEDYLKKTKKRIEDADDPELAQELRRRYQRANDEIHQRFTKEGQTYLDVRDNYDALKKIAAGGSNDPNKVLEASQILKGYDATKENYFAYRGIDDIDYEIFSKEYDDELQEAKKKADEAESEYDTAISRYILKYVNGAPDIDTVKRWVSAEREKFGGADPNKKWYFGNKDREQAAKKAWEEIISLAKKAEQAGMAFEEVTGKKFNLDAMRVGAKYGFDAENFDHDAFVKWVQDHGMWIYDDNLSEIPGGVETYNKTYGKNLTESEYKEMVASAKKDYDLLKVLSTTNQTRENIESGGWAATWENIKNFAKTPVRGVEGLFYTGKSAINGRVDIYDPLLLNQYYDEAVKDTTQKEYTSKWFGGAEVGGQNLGNFLYGAGSSVVENGINIAVAYWLGAGLGLAGEALQTATSRISLSLMAGDVSAKRIMDAKRNGASDTESIILGAAAGVTEALTEKYSIEQILSGNIWGSIIAEGSEEYASNVIGRAVDDIVRPATNDMKMSYYHYRNEGYSEKDALTKVIYDMMIDDAGATLGGMLSGGTLGAGSAVRNRVSMTNYGRNIANNGDPIGTINEGLGFGTDTDTYKNAERLTQKMLGEAKGGKAVSNYEIGKQAAMNAEVNAKNRSDIADFGKTFGKNGKNVFTRFYLDGQNTAEYSREMNAAYNAGRLGEAMPENHLRQEQAEAMYVAGYIDNQGKKGVIESRNSEAFKADNPDIYKTLDGIGKKYDTRIIIDEAIDGADGYFDPERDELHINANAQNPIMVVVKHELTHMIEGTEEYDELVNFMRENFADEWAQKENDIKGLYERVNAVREMKGLDIIELSDPRLSSEVMAELSEKFESEEFLERVATENPSMLRKVLNYIKDIVKRIGSYFTADEAKRWQKAQRMWEDAVNNAEVAERTGDVEYKILPEVTDENGNTYKNVVLLDTDFFDGISPRNWGESLKKYISERTENSTFILPIIDENGNKQMLEFARKNDAVTTKNGNYRKVQSKLYTTSENISKLSVIHIDEIVEVSKEKVPYYTNENKTHQWLDENGWLHRTATVQNAKNGKLYQITLDIAKAKDGRIILYAVNGNIKNLGQAPIEFNALQGSKDSELQSQDYEGMIAQKDDVVKTFSEKEFKLQEPTEVETALAEENAELKRQIEGLQKRAATAEKRLETVKTPQVVEKDINKLAGRLIKDYGSDLKRADIADGLRDLGNYILRRKTNDYSFETVKEKAYGIANLIMEYAQAETPYADIYKAIKQFFRDTPIKVENKGDFPDYNNFRQSLMGRLTLSDKGRTIDNYWAVLGEMFGEGLFPPDIIAESDMIELAADYVSNIDHIFFNPYDTNKAEMREIIAGDIIEGLLRDVRSVKEGDALELNEKLLDAKRRIAEVENRKSEIAKKEKELAFEFAELYKKKIEHMKEKQKLKEQQTEKKEREERQILLKIVQRVTSKRFYDSLSSVTKAEIDELVGDLDTAAVGILKTTKNKLSDWANRYNELAAENGFEPNREIEAAIRRLDRKQIQDLNIDEVRSLTDMLITIEHEVHTANRLLAETERAEIRERGLRIISDIMATGGKKSERASNLMQEVLEPERMINRVVGHNHESPLVRAFRNMQDGQTKMYDYQMEANRRFGKYGKKFYKSIQGKHARTIIIEGKGSAGRQKLKITPAMAMSLYMHSQNYQNMRHIAEGGLAIPDYELMRKGKRTEAKDKAITIKLDRTDINMAIKQLTADEMAFCHDVAEFYKWSADKINEVSNILLGHDIARVGNYFPIFTDENFVNFDLTEISDEGSLSSMGFLNERKNSVNPIYLLDINDVVKRSIGNQSRYVGLAVPVRDMNKLLQVADVTAERIEPTGDQFEDIIARGKREINFLNSVQKAIKQKWGSETWDYIRKFVDDYQGKNQQRTKNEQTISKLKSSAAVSALVFNAGVAFKQLASYPAAAVEIGYRPLLRAMTMKVNQELLDKSSLYWYRKQGWSNAEISEFKENGGHLPKFLNWIQAADLFTTKRLFAATEAYIKKTQPELSGKEYEQAVLDKYHDVLRRTQPNYTILERPGLMRDRSFWAQIKSLYKTVPFQNLNILVDARGDLKAQQNRLSAYKEGIVGYDEAKEAVKKARTRYVHAITSQAVSSFVFALMQWAVDVWLHKDKDYKDENGEYTFWSVAKKLGINMVGNGFGMLPFGNLMWETLAQGTDNVSQILGGDKIFGVTSYGISNPMIGMIGDVSDTSYNTLMDITKAFKGAAEGEKVDWEALVRSSFRTAKAVLALKNIPLNNAQKELHALAKNVIYWTKGADEGKYWDLRLEYDPKDNKGKFYDLLYRERKGKGFDKIKNLLIERDGFTEDDINDAMIDRYVKRETPYKDLYELYTKQPERVSEVIKTFTIETAELKGNIYKKMAKMMSEDKKFLDNGFTAEDIEKGTDDVSKEIQRLNKYLKDTEIKLEEETEVEQSNGSLMPTAMPNIIKVGDKDYKFLTADEWKNAETEAQNTAKEIIEEGIKTGYYKNLSDDDKAKFIKKCFTYAKESSKMHITNSKYMPSDKWVATAASLRKSMNVPVVTYIEIYNLCGAVVGDSPGVHKKKIIDERVKSAEARKILYDQFNVGKKVQSGEFTQADIDAKKGKTSGGKKKTGGNSGGGRVLW